MSSTWGWMKLCPWYLLPHAPPKPVYPTAYSSWFSKTFLTRKTFRAEKKRNLWRPRRRWWREIFSQQTHTCQHSHSDNMLCCSTTEIRAVKRTLSAWEIARLRQCEKWCYAQRFVANTTAELNGKTKTSHTVDVYETLKEIEKQRAESSGLWV